MSTRKRMTNALADATVAPKMKKNLKTNFFTFS